MAEKNLVYRGKSKDVYKITTGPYAGKYRFVFTDRATGYIENGKETIKRTIRNRELVATADLLKIFL